MQWTESSPLDAIEGVMLMVITVVLIYAVVMVQRAIQGVVLVLTRDNQQIRNQLAKMWQRQEELEVAAAEATKVLKRLEALEERTGGSDRAALGEWVGRAWQHIVKTEARLEALEKGEPPPPGTRPTDPPL